MAFRFSNTRPTSTQSFVNGLFDTVCITGIPLSVPIQDIRQFFRMTEGPCICSNLPEISSRNAIALRFSQPTVAQRVLLRYNNVVFRGFKLEVFPVVGNLLASVLPLLQQQYNLEQKRYLQQKQQEYLLKNQQQRCTVPQPRLNTQYRSHYPNYKGRPRFSLRGEPKRPPRNNLGVKEKIRKENHDLSNKHGSARHYHSHQSDNGDSKVSKEYSSDDKSLNKRRLSSSSSLDASESIFYTEKLSSSTIPGDVAKTNTVKRLSNSSIDSRGHSESVSSNVSSMRSFSPESYSRPDESNQPEAKIIEERCKHRDVDMKKTCKLTYSSQTRYPHGGRSNNSHSVAEKRKFDTKFDDQGKNNKMRIKMDNNGDETRVKSPISKRVKDDNHLRVPPSGELRTSPLQLKNKQNGSTENPRSIKTEVSTEAENSPQWRVETGVEKDYKEVKIVGESNGGNNVENSVVAKCASGESVMKIKQEPLDDTEMNGSCPGDVSRAIVNRSLSQNAKLVLEEVKTRLAAMRSLETDEVLKNVLSFTKTTEKPSRSEEKLPENAINDASLPTEQPLLNSELSVEQNTGKELSDNGSINTPNKAVNTMVNHRDLTEDPTVTVVNENDKITGSPSMGNGCRIEEDVRERVQIKHGQDAAWYNSPRTHQENVGQYRSTEYCKSYPRQEETVFDQGTTMPTTEHRGNGNGFRFQNERHVFNAELNYVDKEIRGESGDQQSMSPDSPGHLHVDKTTKVHDGESGDRKSTLIDSSGLSHVDKTTREAHSEVGDNLAMNYHYQFDGVITEDGNPGNAYDDVFEDEPRWEGRYKGFDDNTERQGEPDIPDFYAENGYENHVGDDVTYGLDHDDISNRFPEEATGIYQPEATMVDPGNCYETVTPNTYIPPQTYRGITPEAYRAVTCKRTLERIIGHRKRLIENEYEREAKALFCVMKKLASKHPNMAEYLKDTFQDSLTELEKRLEDKLRTMMDKDYQTSTRQLVHNKIVYLRENTTEKGPVFS